VSSGRQGKTKTVMWRVHLYIATCPTRDSTGATALGTYSSPRHPHAGMHLITPPPVGTMTTGTFPPRRRRREDTRIHWYSPAV